MDLGKSTGHGDELRSKQAVILQSFRRIGRKGGADLARAAGMLKKCGVGRCTL